MEEQSYDPIDLFLRSVGNWPHRPALTLGGQSWTYAELDTLSLRVAEWCRTCCAGERRIAIHGAKGILAYAGILGVLRSGRSYVPLHPAHPVLRWQGAHDLASLRAVIAPSGAISNLRKAGFRTILEPQGLPQSTAEARSEPSAEAYVMFTSGSTGEPKGVPVGRAQVAAYLKHFLSVYPSTPEDRFTQFFALSFDLSVHDLFVCWGSGACLCVPSDEGAMQALAFAREQRITSWFSVPSLAALLRRMKALKPDVLPHLRHAFFCGEALPVDLARDWCLAAPKAETVNLYGPTETTIAITAQQVGQEQLSREQGIIPLGRPFPGHEARVRREDGLAGSGEGELVLSGPQVNAGYLGGGQGADAFFESAGLHWYATGDRVYLADDGVLHFLGRVDGQVKLAGHRVEPGEVDAILKPLLGGGMSITVPVQGHITTVLTTFIDKEMDQSLLFAALRERIPPYMLPDRIIVVRDFPYSPHGKLDRQALIDFALHG